MFEHLTRFNVIFVTGPQRSGTRICAKMIAQDTGYTYIDEQEFGADDLSRLEPILRDPIHLVIQCPALQHVVHKLAKDSDLVVLMRRDIADIIMSQKRVGWDWEAHELSKYPRNLQHLPVSEAKYRYWNHYQVTRVKSYVEIDYDSLSEHPLWLPREQRKDFDAFQTEARSEETT